MKKTLLSLTIIMSTLLSSNGQIWNTMALGLGNNSNAVKAIAENPVTHEIYAGGTFTGTLNYLAKWNGTSWIELGTGVSGPVYALAFKNQELYVGGLFSSAGGVAVNNIAKWAGSAWSDVGGGFNDQVNCIFINSLSGSVYAGGKFSLASGLAMNHISKLVSTTWNQMGAGIGANVNAITEYNSSIYCGSDMTSTPLNRYDGTSWSAIPSTDLTGGKIYALASYGGSLYVGGDFSIPTFAAAKFNGTTWGTIQTNFGVNDKVYALYKGYNNILYLGGKFTNLGVGGLASYAAKITSVTNPIQTITLSTSTVNGEVYAISSQSYKPVIGGTFSSPATNVAITSVSISVEELNDLIIEKSFFPNPAHERATLTVSTKQNFLKPDIKLFDLQSRSIGNVPTTIENKNNSFEITLDLHSLAPGNYYYTVTEEGKAVFSDKFIVE